MTAVSPTPDRDYPQLLGERGLIEPAPRRVRGYFDQALVFDTTRAHYVWEIAYYPQYYIPTSDVRMELLHDENHIQKLQFGSSRLYSLTSAERTRPSAARVFDSGPVAGSVRFEWDALDWFEEDEPLILHPRNPYVRVDSLRSHRHIRVELDGVVLAETHSPVLLFETGLPTRFYIDRTDVDFSHLEPSKTESVCPYKGITSAYWTFRNGDAVYPDIAWAYDYPLREVGDHQYLTTGMPPSRGGDSGAPVWAVGDDGRVQVLGIWLGGRTTADGHDYGRFAALSSAVSALGITSAD